jgi:hypothetical protein
LRQKKGGSVNTDQCSALSMSLPLKSFNKILV